MQRALFAAAAAASAAAVPVVPSITLTNTAAPGVTMPAIGLGCGAYSNANAGYNAYPECWIGDGGATGGGSGTCGAFVEQAVTSWLEAGGRRLDAANSYQDQVNVGNALNKFLASSGVPRSDIFLLSKVGPSHPLGGADAKAQFEGVLAEMQVDYVDLLLVHWPWDSASKGNVTNNSTTSSTPLCNHTSPMFDERLCRLDTWQGMLDIFASGRARAVGVSNYNVSHFEEIVAAGMPLPALTQNPFHLYRSSTQSDIIDWTARHGVAFLGYACTEEYPGPRPLPTPKPHPSPSTATFARPYPNPAQSPFGVPDYHKYSFVGAPAANQLQHPYVQQVAAKYGASPAQVLIQWQWQLGVPSNPRSMNATHQAENLAAFSLFAAVGGLNQTEMDTLSSQPQDLCSSDASGWYECAY